MPKNCCINKIQRNKFTDKRDSLTTSTIQRFVDALNQPFEHAFVAGFANSFDGEFGLFGVLSLLNRFSSDFNSGTKKSFSEFLNGQSQQVADLLGNTVLKLIQLPCNDSNIAFQSIKIETYIWQASLIRSLLLGKADVSEQKDGTDDAQNG